jgi:hypothetical protein
MRDWSAIDNQLQRFGPFLRDQFKLSPDVSNKLASTMAQEVKGLRDDVINLICSEDTIGLRSRLQELVAFREWMDIANRNAQLHPAIGRAHVITRNYFCFVYLGDICFKILRKYAASGTVTKKCCKFLTDNPIRAFRNAIAHGNWKYRDDYSGLVFWARKGDDEDEPLSKFEASEDELNFWQAIACCTAFVTFTTIADNPAYIGC